uniref:Alpha-2-macroglobulin bait region domain-containing protein n=1 Tax=Megaselia scalaris TaxID=36166 RepID=T1H4Z1_MEGSC
MAPNVKVVVFLYNKGDLKKKEVTVNFEKELENQFVIDACDEAKPGQEVELSLKTAQNSFIGLLGLDQSVLLLKSGNDLDASNIFNKIEQNFFGGCFRGGCFPPRSSSSLIIITNADFEQEDERHYPKMYAMRAYSPMSAQPMMFGSAGSVRTARNIEPPRIRKEFPETWIWEDIET